MFDLLDDAIYNTVHDYRDGDNRGAVALSPKVNIGATVLSNKVNPFCESHHLGLKESIPIQLTAGNYSILRVYAQILGHAVFQVPDMSGMSDANLLTDYANWNAEIGETHDAIRRALTDGQISRRELAAIEAEMYQDFERELGLLARLRSMAR